VGAVPRPGADAAVDLARDVLGGDPRQLLGAQATHALWRTLGVGDGADVLLRLAAPPPTLARAPLAGVGRVGGVVTAVDGLGRGAVICLLGHVLGDTCG